MKNFIKKYIDYIYLFGFGLICYYIFIHLLGTYPLLDADETRYADIARTMFNSGNYLTPMLDGKIFWDKPPLYFWIECLSFGIFKSCNEFTVRIPDVACSIASALGLFFIGRKLISRNFGLICALILITSVEYVIFAKVAILDMILTTFTTIATLCGFVTYFVAEQRKKYWWWGFYICSALAVLAKGAPGIILPFGIMFFVGLWKRNLKEFFKPIYLIPGLLLFLIVALPWHVIMYKVHGWEFIHEYIIKHHLMRFVGSEEIGREHSWVYYIPVFIVGFLPWTMSLICAFYHFIKNRNRLKINHFILMNAIGFTFTFLFFSMSKTKLITYILPVYSFAAVITGYIWYKFIKNYLFRKPIEISVYITNSTFIIVGLAILLMGFFLPATLYTDVKALQFELSFIFIFCGILGLWALNRNKRLLVFVSNILISLFLAGFCFPQFFNIWYKFGQNDLMKYANYARDNHFKLAAISLWERYSLQYYYSGDVLYYKFPEEGDSIYVNTTNLNKELGDYIVVLEHKNLKALDLYKIKYNVLFYGKRYDLIYGPDIKKRPET